MTLDVKIKETKITLTGATGFIGFAVTKKLVSMGHFVQVICRASSDIQKLRDLSKEIVITRYDGDIADLFEPLEKFCPDCVVHMATQNPSSKGARGLAVSEFIKANIQFPAHLLEAMVNAGVTNFVNTESYWQYGETLDRYAANSIYAATKSGFKEILNYYATRRGISCISLVLGDTYGPYDQREKIMNALKKSLDSGHQLNMTEGHQLLSLTHIEDVTDAYLRALELLAKGRHAGLETYSIGLGEPRTLRTIVEIAEQAIDRKFCINWGSKPYRDTDLSTIPKGRPLPGWRPRISLSRGLQEFFKGS